MNIRIFRQRDPNHRFVPLFAKNDPDGRRFVQHLFFAVKAVHVHLHLAEVLMGELAQFEVDQNVAVEQAVVEIDEVMLFVEREAALHAVADIIREMGAGRCRDRPWVLPTLPESGPLRRVGVRRIAV